MMSFSLYVHTGVTYNIMRSLLNCSVGLSSELKSSAFPCLFSCTWVLLLGPGPLTSIDIRKGCLLVIMQRIIFFHFPNVWNSLRKKKNEFFSITQFLIIISVNLFSCCCFLVAKSYPALLWPHELQPTRLLCPWNFPGKSTGVGDHFLLQRIFPTQGSNPHLLHWQVDSLPGNPLIFLLLLFFFFF